MQEQQEDRKANIPTPFADWAEAAGYERDEDNPSPELGSLRTQRKAGIGEYAEDTDGTPDGTPCPFCGRIHGAPDTDENTEVAGVGDPIAERDFEEQVSAALGALLGDGFKNIPITMTDGPFLAKDDLIVLNAALQLTAATIMSIDHLRNGDVTKSQQYATISSNALNTIKSLVGSNLYAVSTLQALGESLLELAQDMNDGKTTGLIRAPF